MLPLWVEGSAATMGIAQLDGVPLDELDEDEEVLDVLDEEVLDVLDVLEVLVDVDVEVDVLDELGPDPPSPPPPPVPMLVPSAHAVTAPAVRSASEGNHTEPDNQPFA